MAGELENAEGLLGRIKDLLLGHVDLLKSADDGVVKLGKDASTSFQNIGDIFSNLNDTYKEINTGIGALDKGIKGISLDKIIGGLLDIKNILVDEKMFDVFAGDAKTQFSSVADNITALGGTLSAVAAVAEKLHLPGDKAKDFIERLSGLAASGQKAEAGFYAMLGASGNLDKAWDSATKTLDNLGGKTANYIENLTDVAEQTGFDVKQTIEWGQALDKIPGQLGSVVRAGDGAGDTIDHVTAALRLASGSGRDFKDVAAAMSEAYQNLGNAQGEVFDQAQKGAEYFATMSEMSRTLRLDFTDVQSIMNSVAEQFKFVGDNTSSVAKVFDMFAGSLQKTGLTAKASAEIVRGMVDQVTKLNMGTKAFISGQAGGAGGLLGAVQIEQMIRSNRIDDVVKMMRQGLLRQVGGQGNILTLQDVHTQQQAAQFTYQRQLLQSGVFGIGAGATDEQANRILEALKSGRADDFKDIATGQKAVEDTTKAGAEIQKRQTTIFNKMAIDVQRSAIANELMAGAELRRTFGAGATDTQVQKLLDTFRNTAAVRTVERAGTDIGRVQENEQQATGRMREHIGQAVVDDVKNLVHAMGDRGKELVESERRAAGTDRGPAPAPAGRPAPPHDGDVQRRRLDAQLQAKLNTAAVPAAPPREPIRQVIAAQEAKEKEAKTQQVHLQIEVTAPHGFGAKIKTTSPTATITSKSMNPTAPDHGADPGY